MKPEAMLLIYGEGGHKAQMKRLLLKLLDTGRCCGMELIGICEKDQKIYTLINYSLLPIRDKHLMRLTIFNIPKNIWLYCKQLRRIKQSCKVKNVIPTGSGRFFLPELPSRMPHCLSAQTKKAW